MRKWFFPLAPLAILALASAAAAQDPTTAAAREVAERWRTTPADSTVLAYLVRHTEDTGDTGGEHLLRAVLATAADASRPGEVRVTAIAVLGAYMSEPGAPEWVAWTREFARLAVPVCEPAAWWSPGDTARVCGQPPSYIRRVYPSYHHLSVPAALHDTVRAALRRLVDADTSRMVVAAATYVLTRRTGQASLWPSHAPIEDVPPPARPRPATRAPAAPADTARVHAQDEVTEPPVMTNGNAVIRSFTRSYPALLKDAGVGGWAVLEMVVGREGWIDVESVRVVRASHREFERAAIRIVERMRFTPARVGDTAVPARIEIPVTFAVGAPPLPPRS